jgi:hypothetical protein
MDFKSGQFIEKENLLPTRDDLYQMSDPQRMVDLLKDHLALEPFAFKAELIRELDRNAVDELASRLEFPINWLDESTLRSQAGALLDRYSLRATRWVLAKVRDFARQNGKKLLVVLFDPSRAMRAAAPPGWRASL